MTKATITHKDINESSTLVYGVRNRSVVYTLNDENGPIYALDPVTGKGLWKFSLKGVKLKDPEALDLSTGANFTLWDGGNNDLDRSVLQAYVFPEPAFKSTAAIKATKYDLAYPAGHRFDSETLLVHPITGAKSVLTKSEGEALIFDFPDDLTKKSINHLVPAGVLDLSLVSDGSFTPDGKHALFREKGVRTNVAVVEWETRRLVDRITVEAVDQPESIAVRRDGEVFSFGSEGLKSPLFTDVMPEWLRDAA